MSKESPSQSCAAKKYVFRQLTPAVIAVAVAGLLSSSSWSATAPTKVTIHVPSRVIDHAVLFGKDKGFFGSSRLNRSWL